MVFADEEVTHPKNWLRKCWEVSEALKMCFDSVTTPLTVYPKEVIREIHRYL